MGTMVKVALGVTVGLLMAACGDSSADLGEFQAPEASEGPAEAGRKPTQREAAKRANDALRKLGELGENLKRAGEEMKEQERKKVEAEAREDERVRKEVPEAALELEQFRQEYEANEVAAEERYKGKVVQLTGAVKSIESHPWGASVQLEGEQYFVVNCTFQDSERPKLAELTKGQLVTIRGQHDGKAGYVNLKRCFLAQ